MNFSMLARDRFVLIASPARGDEPWLMLVVRITYSRLGEPKAIRLVHIEHVPADQAGNEFAATVDRRRSILQEKFDRECDIAVDMTQYSQAEKLFIAIADADFYVIKTGDKPLRFASPREVGRNYLLDGIATTIRNGILHYECGAEHEQTVRKALAETEAKPPKIEPIEALLSDASANERLVLCLGLAIEVAGLPVLENPLPSGRNAWMR
jgi:hypothetical protein